MCKGLQAMTTKYWRMFHKELCPMTHSSQNEGIKAIQVLL